MFSALKRMFGGSSAPLLPHREECNRLAFAALHASGIEFDRASQLEQALVGTFVFGMIHAECMKHALDVPQAYAIALCVFQDTLHYTPKAAAEGVQACIDATAPGVHDTMRAIMHHGIDGHAQLATSDVAALTANIRGILSQFSKNG
jgi:hypothetical protein